MTAQKRKKIQDLTEDKLAFNKAVDLLAMRMHSREELRRKLSLRKFSKDCVSKVITKLSDLRYLNDEEFARVYAENLVRSKTYGYYGIRAKLMQRGIESKVADEAVSEALDENIESKLAQKFLSRKHSQNKLKMMMSLKQRGFRSSVIARAVKDAPSDNEF